jgi:hypothetical protein
MDDIGISVTLEPREMLMWNNGALIHKAEPPKHREHSDSRWIQHIAADKHEKPIPDIER